VHRVLILGGGFGGVATAHALRQKLTADDQIVLVDRRPQFMLGPRKSWVLTGRGGLEEGQRPLAALEQRGIRVIIGTVTAIEPAQRAADVDGRRIEADAVVVALGAELAPDQVPGFAEYALNVYDPEAVPRAAEALRRFGGGRAMIGIFGTPYKCPPAPYEMAILVQELFQQRRVDATLEVFTPQPMSIPLLGPAGCSAIEGPLAERGIGFLPGRKASSVAPGEVVFAQERRGFDLLLGVPPHRCPAVVVQSGLAEAGGWVRVDRRTLETRFPGVYAIGDVTEIALADGKPLPKAGIFAEGEGRVVAERIAASFAGRAREAVFDGIGHCFMEVGNDEALLVRGRFLAEPAPEVETTEPSRRYRDEKFAFEAERLKEWFGY
jgi:sulfide:quinone oxidoreductase